MADNNVILRGVTCKVTACISCGIPFTVPLNVYEQHKTHGGFHSCPNGHQQGWDKDNCEDGRIRRERDRLKQEVAYLEDMRRQEKDRAERAERRASAFKGQTTRLRNRAKAGICPCCNRHFTNLERHMAGQHPDFSAEPDEVST